MLWCFFVMPPGLMGRRVLVQANLPHKGFTNHEGGVFKEGIVGAFC